MNTYIYNCTDDFLFLLILLVMAEGKGRTETCTYDNKSFESFAL